MIRKCTDADFEDIYSTINDAATAYKGIIPADRWKEPYMPREELAEQIADGVEFCGYETSEELSGVMGVQDREDVCLIRHAYVRSHCRKRGIGGKLLEYLYANVEKPVLIGTWKDAVWAIEFYRKHGFNLVDEGLKDRLLRRYWKIPERQVETSVVLADNRFMSKIVTKD